MLLCVNMIILIDWNQIYSKPVRDIRRLNIWSICLTGLSPGRATPSCTQTRLHSSWNLRPFLTNLWSYVLGISFNIRVFSGLVFKGKTVENFYWIKRNSSYMYISVSYFDRIAGIQIFVSICPFCIFIILRTVWFYNQ